MRKIGLVNNYSNFIHTGFIIYHQATTDRISGGNPVNTLGPSRWSLNDQFSNLPDWKSVFAFLNRNGSCIHVFNMHKSSAFDSHYNCIYLFFIPLYLHAHTSVPLVVYPAGTAEMFSGIAGTIAEANALYTAVKDYMSAYQYNSPVFELSVPIYRNVFKIYVINYIIRIRKMQENEVLPVMLQLQQ